jgi:hypothetical protein
MVATHGKGQVTELRDVGDFAEFVNLPAKLERIQADTIQLLSGVNDLMIRNVRQSREEEIVEIVLRWRVFPGDFAAGEI